MHREHDHHHHLNGGRAAHPSPGTGHNHVGATVVAQWQTPHLDQPGQDRQLDAHQEPDLDQVETAFVDGFTTATDPTSFLRLANIPFETVSSDGAKLVLLRVETDAIVDVGSVMPHLGGGSFRYDPLPAAMTAKRRRLRFVYFDGNSLRKLGFAEVRAFAAGLPG